MNLKLKYVLLPLLQSVIPFVMLILGPYIGLHAKNAHGRLVQLVGGTTVIAFIWIVNYFLGYRREKDVKEILDRIRARGSQSVSVGGSVDVI